MKRPPGGRSGCTSFDYTITLPKEGNLPTRVFYVMIHSNLTHNVEDSGHPIVGKFCINT